MAHAMGDLLGVSKASHPADRGGGWGRVGREVYMGRAPLLKTHLSLPSIAGHLGM